MKINPGIGNDLNQGMSDQSNAAAVSTVFNNPELTQSEIISGKTSNKRLMKTAVFNSPRDIKIVETEIREPNPDEVRIKLEGCGLCTSNIPVWEGRPWFSYPIQHGSPGHEAWGRIDAVGSNIRGIKEGDLVAAISYNAFAEYDITPANSVVLLPNDLEHIPFPGEPLGCAVNIFNRSGVQKDHVVAVIGIGFLGALLVQIIKQTGAKVIAISMRQFSLDVAKQYDADETILMDDHWKIIERVKEVTNGEFCDRVIECTGKQWPLDLAGELTKIRGKIIIAGYHQDGARQVNMQLWNWRGLDIINAHERDQKIYIDGIKKAVQFVSDGKLDPSNLYTHFYNLENISEAFETAANRPDGFMKAIIKYA